MATTDLKNDSEDTDSSFKIEMLTRVTEGLNQPWGVAVNSSSDVIVCEWGAHRITVFNQHAQKVRSFGGEGSKTGQFLRPRGVAVDSNDNIYVVDCGNGRVQKFTPTGDFLLSTPGGSQGSGKLEFNNAAGIAYNKRNGLLYIGDQDNHRIQVLTTDFSFHSTFGNLGGKNKEFNSPAGVCCDVSGNVYVADFNNHRIQVFTGEGKFEDKFGLTDKSSDHNVSYPLCIAIKDDFVFVSEKFKGCISVFTLNGAFIQSFGKQGSSHGQFKCPVGVAVDKDGIISVVDYLSNRMQAFQIA